jgi:hypothetical protein
MQASSSPVSRLKDTVKAATITIWNYVLSPLHAAIQSAFVAPPFLEVSSGVNLTDGKDVASYTACGVL